MALSKKHYEQFAQIVRQQYAHINQRNVEQTLTTSEWAAASDALRRTAESMAVHFALDNPLFNRARFLAACGFEG
jgi:hypothetical protein